MKIFIIACLSMTITTTIGLDYLFTLYQHSAFYISESLLFSSYWMLFFPLLYIQSRISDRTNKLRYNLLMVPAVTLLHLLLYPVIVWVFSKVFYGHTFAYWQTFNFGLNTYLIKSLIIYGFAFVTFVFLKNKLESITIDTPDEKKNFISSIIVSVNNNKIAFSTDNISCFSANPPYVTIYCQGKKYLHSETLKSLQTQLNANQFVRIHKSHIVNLHMINSYQSRQNGDYDVSLSDGSILRVSRNYAKDFKAALEKYTRVAAK